MPIQRAKPRFIEVKNVSIGASQIAANAVGATQLDLTDNYAFSGTVSGAGDPNYRDEIDQWELASNNYNTSATITTWQRAAASTSAKLGTGVSMSSGVFTFPKTGIYQITVNGIFYNAVADAYQAIITQVTTNNSSYSTVGNAVAGDSSGGQWTNAMSTVLFNCTNTSTHKARLQTASVDHLNHPSQNYTGGSNANVHSFVLFERVG